VGRSGRLKRHLVEVGKRVWAGFWVRWVELLWWRSIETEAAWMPAGREAGCEFERQDSSRGWEIGIASDGGPDVVVEVRLAKLAGCVDRQQDFQL
jgi:hypothetical protein